jgi:hypothetical protein
VALLRAGQHGSIVGRGATEFRSAMRPIPSTIHRAQSALSQGVKQPECEVDYPPQYSTEFRNAWS